MGDSSPSATLQLALNTLKKLAAESGKLPENCVIHSDRGETYTSETYIKAVKTIGAQSNYSRSGRCFGNASMESFYGHIKNVTFYRMSSRDRIHLTRDKAREVIADYVRWYNSKRILISRAIQRYFLTPASICLDRLTKNIRQIVVEKTTFGVSSPSGYASRQRHPK